NSPSSPPVLQFSFALGSARPFLVVFYSLSTSLDVGLDLQSTSHCLVVIGGDPIRLRRGSTVTRFHVGFDFQATRHGLIVLQLRSARFHISVDFHTRLFLL